MEKTNVELDRYELFSLFNSLLVREHCIFRKEEQARKELLNKLWVKVDDRTKFEVLYSKQFRELLKSWSIPYQEDLKRLGISEKLEDKEE